MPFDGNGNWIADFSAVNDRDSNIKILASRFDDIHQADLKESFENCLTKDGQVKPLQAFNANNFKVINVANPTQPNDAVNLSTLNSKDSKAVHLSGNETITGEKTFSGNLSLTGDNNYTGTNTFSGRVFINGKEMTDQNIVGLVMPDYDTAVSLSSSIPAPYDCMVECGITSNYNSGWVEINGSRRQLGNGRDDSHDMWYTAYVPKGITIAASGCNVSRYYKLKGV